MGRRTEAIAALQQALHFRPHYAKAYANLGNVLEEAGRVGEAMQADRAALAIHPELVETRYDLAALGGMPPPPCTPRPYLTRLFDTYAASFDQHLVETLHYRVPEVLHELAPALQPGADLDIIDLGCGTGLVGRLFRGIAARLTGIDVSAGMLQEAARRQVYDQLVLDDVVNYLNARSEPCDLVLAADVFIYIGDLAPVVQAVASLACVPAGCSPFPWKSPARPTISGSPIAVMPTR